MVKGNSVGFSPFNLLFKFLESINLSSSVGKNSSRKWSICSCLESALFRLSDFLKPMALEGYDIVTLQMRDLANAIILQSIANTNLNPFLSFFEGIHFFNVHFLLRLKHCRKCIYKGLYHFSKDVSALPGIIICRYINWKSLNWLQLNSRDRRFESCCHDTVNDNEWKNFKSGAHDCLLECHSE